jgi:hypothetical protein
MKPRRLTLAISPLLALLGACGQSPSPGPTEKGASAGEPAQDPVARMNAAIDALMEKPEHQAQEITLQHILIGVSGRLPGVTRTPAEAEQLTAEILGKIQAGEDFDTLVKNYTNDSHPGIYTLLLSGQGNQAANIWGRKEMVAAFGDVGWRLQPGEIGVAPYDGAMPGGDPKSPFGYHIIKRVK